MEKFDVLIVGGGMVGLSLALAIRKNSSLTVAIVDGQPLTEISDEPDVRVSAINAVSQKLFKNLDVWLLIAAGRAQPYQHMHIWDKEGYGHIDFNVTDVTGVNGEQQLGWIIENSVIRSALWNKAEQDSGIQFFTEDKLTNIAIGDSDVFASFEQKAPITAKLIVGADGARSWVREQMGIALTFRDYDHHAIVATVKTPQSHQNTAWQVFLQTGPLAFLPLSIKKENSDLCSIVWSTSPDEAKRLMSLPAEQFAKELSSATDGKLGNIELVSNRAVFPLTMRYAQNFVKNRAVLVGDAAHTIHPLAGQGVNLGLLDAAALAQTLTASFVGQSNSGDASTWLSPIKLGQYERWRKTEAVEMIGAMEAIKQTFTPQQTPIKLLRGIGMSVVNQLMPVKNKLIEQAMGLKGHLPKLCK